MKTGELRGELERIAANDSATREEALPVLEALFDALECGSVRAAEPGAEGWSVNRWVKLGILLGFRVGVNQAVDLAPVFHFLDRDTYPTLDPRRFGGKVRIVPGGTTVRRGCYLGEGVVIMPPAYVNVGAYVGKDSMIDSHVLVGSCAQIGEGVHLSAGTQIGGVLEPAGALPVVVEDGVFVGGGCGLYEGTRVGAGAVVAPGVVLTRAVPIHDLVRGCAHRAAPDGVLSIPEDAVVVPGSRPARGEYARRHGIELQSPVIVKYRDAGTDAALVLEEALR